MKKRKIRTVEDISQELCMIQCETEFPAIKTFWEIYHTHASCQPVTGDHYIPCMQEKYEYCMQKTYDELGKYMTK